MPHRSGEDNTCVVLTLEFIFIVGEDEVSAGEGFGFMKYPDEYCPLGHVLVSIVVLPITIPTEQPTSKVVLHPRRSKPSFC